MTATPRPRQSDESVVRAAAKMLAPKVLEWARDEHLSEEQVVDDLTKVGRYLGDGYELAREMESRCHYGPDSELVEILDVFTFKKHDACRDAVADWVKENSIAPEFGVGDTVECDLGRGPIVEVNREQAYYLVCLEDEAAKSPGYIGTHVFYERAKKVMAA